jgi:hypothetical protein
VANPQKAEVLICFPSGDSDVCDTAAVYNWISKAWGMRTLTDCTYAATGQINADATLLQWDSDNDAWDTDATSWSENEYAAAEARVLFARTSAISAFDVGTTDFGSEIASYLERTGMSLDTPEQVKWANSVRPRIDAPTGTVVNVQMGGAMDPMDAVEWSAVSPFTVGDTKADLSATGRFLAMRFTGTGYQPWRMRSLSADVRLMGMY